MSRNVLAFIGACALIIIFRVQIIQIVNLIAQSAAAGPTTR
jgi:hypothetical protein